MQNWSNLFLSKNFFFGFIFIIGCYVFGFFSPIILAISPFLLFGLIMLSVIDIILLYSTKKPITGHRKVNDKLSNSDRNQIQLNIQNHYSFKIKFKILEELPSQLQILDFEIRDELASKNEKQLDYEITPKERGVYQFGNTNIFVNSPLGLFQRRIVLQTATKIKVYPSFLKLKQFGLHNFKIYNNEYGQKKIRRIGHSMEFEQIKNYVSGDDIRTLNWKATAKTQRLMVNQFIDEKSQQVYCAIDKGRVMKMPFNEMTLLDYSINASLVLSNIVLQNLDRAGIFTFSRKLENLVKAERRTNQLQKISESLYSIETDFMESDFGKLYHTIRQQITQRGLVLLFTNFESLDAMHRQLPYLQGINKSHLLVLVFFKNTEMEDELKNQNSKMDVYERTMIEKFLYEKQQIVLELNKNGIQTILSRPEELTVNTINKYLEIKSRGML